MKIEVKNITILKENQIYNAVPDNILAVGIVKMLKKKKITNIFHVQWDPTIMKTKIYF